MGFFGRLAFGWRLGMTSLGVVMRDKTLMLFPILSAIAGLLLIAAFVMGVGPDKLAALGQQLGEHQARTQGEIPPLYIFLAFSLYFGLSFIAVYFNVALIGAAQLSIAGKDTVLADGLQVANRHVNKIFVWAVLSGTVGLLLTWIESNDKIGRIVRSILGAAWTVITYFVVPVMIFENQAPTSAVRRSVTLMRETWGENAGAQAGIGIVSFVIVLGVGVVTFGAAMLMPQAALLFVPVAVLTVPVVVLMSMAAKAVLTVGLYQFATKSGSGGAFKPEELRAAFR